MSFYNRYRVATFDVVAGGTGAVTHLLFHSISMKKCLLAVKAAFSLLLLSSRLAAAQPTTPNLLINGNLEDRNHAPQGQSNIGPVDRTHPYDDLKNWYHPSSAPYYGAGSSDNSPDYLASDATDPYVNTTTMLAGYGYNGFSSHSGISCVGLLRHDVDGQVRYDEFVTQQLGQALLPGHLYHAEFWVLRLPGGPFHNKLSLSITDADPIFDANASQNRLIPSPGNKVIVSADIQQRLTWTKVSGDIVIPGSETNNRWVTIGFTREGPGYDPALQDDYPLHGIYYAIDDVSLVNMGCAPVADPQALTPDWECVNGPGPIYAYIYDYNPALTYTIITTNNIRNVPANAFTQQYDKYGVLRWAYSLRSVYPGRTGRVTVTATNSCGSSGFTTYNITSPGVECDSGPSNSAVGYPNPATDELRAPAGAERAVLLDSRGKPVQRADASGKLDVQGLPAGLYNLQMRQGGKLINQRIQVKH